jgi:tetratricopeptide (TPR) repeat protein
VGTFGYVAQSEGRSEEAAELFRESAEMAREVGFDWWIRGMLFALAEVELQLGQVEAAERDAREALLTTERADDRRGAVISLALLAWAAAERRDGTRAGLLWGVVEAEGTRGPLGQWEQERDLYAERVSAAHGDEFTRAYEEGRRLSLDQATKAALS